MALQRAAAAMRRLILLAATTHALLLDPDTYNAPIVFSLDAFFDAWATLLSEAMAENAWSASFGDASNENTMGALEVSGSKRSACVVAARRRMSLRIAAAARCSATGCSLSFVLCRALQRGSHTQRCSYNFGTARTAVLRGLNSQALPVPATLIFANIIS